MACRPVVDVPAVVTALEDLKKLETELKEEGMRSESSDHLKNISAAVNELEANRRAAHELLEVETIQNSKLRHQCHHMTEWTAQIMTADVAAARASNTEEIEQLHKHLRTTTQVLESTFHRQEALQAQNDHLRPQRDQVQAVHQDVVLALNRAITQKYRSQKHLEKTKEVTQDLQVLTAALQQDKTTLQKNADIQRQSFTANTDNLSKDMIQTYKDIKLQRQETKNKRRELLRIYEKNQKVNKCLEELRSERLKLENSLQRLRTSRTQYQKQLEEEVQMSQDLKRQRDALKEELGQMKEDFLITVQKHQQDKAALESKMAEGRASRIQWEDTVARTCELYKRQHEEETEERAKHTATSKQLGRSQAQLEERRASIVLHRKEVGHMEQLMEQLVETENINKQMFDQHQEELNANMDTEEKQLRQYEEEKEQLGMFLEEARRKQEEQVLKITVDIDMMKRRCEELRQEEEAIHLRHPVSADVLRLRSHVTQRKAERQERETRQREELEESSAEMERLRRSCEEKQRQVEEQEEVLKEVEAGWNQSMRRHQGLEKLLCEQKEKRSSVEEVMEVLKENTTALLGCKEEKEEELEALRAAGVDLLDRQVWEVQRLERSIFSSRVKVEQVQVENSRLKLHVQQMEEYIRTAGQDRDRYLQEAQRFTEDTKDLEDCGQEVYSQEVLLKQERQRSDAHLMEMMDNLLDHLKSRSVHLRQVRTRLQKDMLDFRRRLEHRTEQKT